MPKFFFGCMIGVIIGAIMAIERMAFHAKADLIQRGLAEYCAADGRFAFKGECK